MYRAGNLKKVSMKIWLDKQTLVNKDSIEGDDEFLVTE